MKIKYGKEITGVGVDIELTGDEIASAIIKYISSRKVTTHGPITVSVNGHLCLEGKIHVFSPGFVIHKGIKYIGTCEEEAQLKK